MYCIKMQSIKIKLQSVLPKKRKTLQTALKIEHYLHKIHYQQITFKMLLKQIQRIPENQQTVTLNLILITPIPLVKGIELKQKPI